MAELQVTPPRGAEAQGNPDPGQECAPLLSDLGKMLRRLEGATRHDESRARPSERASIDRRVWRTTDRPPTGADPHRSPMSPPRQDRASIGANLTQARRYMRAALDAAGVDWTD